MKLVVGLGNPGKRYENTPHNVGFAAVGELAEMLGVSLRRSLRFKARMGVARVGDEDVLLVAPQTFMNNSGQAVGGIMRYRKVARSDLVLLLDDADLDLGRLRIRTQGSSGGHKGLQSVVQDVGGSDFARVRIGIGRDRFGRELVDHVLTPFDADEGRDAAVVVGRAAAATLCIIREGADAAMNRFNGSVHGVNEERPKTVGRRD